LTLATPSWGGAAGLAIFLLVPMAWNMSVWLARTGRLAFAF
jgi:hypothetical protein